MPHVRWLMTAAFAAAAATLALPAVAADACK